MKLKKYFKPINEMLQTKLDLQKIKKKKKKNKLKKIKLYNNYYNNLYDNYIKNIARERAYDLDKINNSKYNKAQDELRKLNDKLISGKNLYKDQLKYNKLDAYKNSIIRDMNVPINQKNHYDKLRKENNIEK